MSLFGSKTQAKCVAVSKPRKKLKEIVTQTSIKLSDGVSHNSDIKILKLGKLILCSRKTIAGNQKCYKREE